VVVAQSPHPSVEILAAAGLISRDDELQVEDLSRSHAVTRVTPPQGQAAVVKMPLPSNLAIGRGLDAELRAYRMAGWVDGLAAALPTPLLIDEARQLLVLRDDGARRSLLELLLAEPQHVGWAADALGRLVAGWHRDTAGLEVPVPALPFGLELERRTADALSVLGERGRRLARDLLADPDLGGAVRAALAGWTPACVIHGDLKWDNCLVVESGGDRRVKVIDWELAGFGDPAWDLGCAIAEQLAFDFEQAVPALLRAYASTGQPLPRNLAVMTATRLLQSAVEREDTDALAGRPSLAREVGERARHVARNAASLEAAWRRGVV
jgi:hypothetical protein